MTDVYLLFVALVLPWQGHQIYRKGVTAFHVINFLLVCGILASLFIRGPRPRWYLIVPFYVYMLGSVIAMFSSEVYLINLYTLSQDLYLYAWFVIMCLFLDSNRRVELLVAAWVILGVVYVLSTQGFWAPGGGIARVEFSFRNPNRASAYLTLSFFMLLHPVVPWVVKGVLAVLLAHGVSATGSAAGSLGLGLGVFSVIWALMYMQSAKAIRPFLFLGVVLLALIVLLINPMKENSLPTVLGGMAPTAAPRIERSADTREAIWAKGMESFREHPMGIGPASFHKQIDSGISDNGRIELHSDFVASLVERGVIGLLGHLMLIAWMAREIFRMLNRSSTWSESLWAAGLTGACVNYLFYSITHEGLHHETFWLMLAFVISQVKILEAKDALTLRLPQRLARRIGTRVGVT
jgi:O-antigen ligase